MLNFNSVKLFLIDKQQTTRLPSAIETENRKGYMSTELRFESYQKSIQSALDEVLKDLNQPDALYEPIRYTMAAKGKRFRPLMTVLSAAVWGKNFDAALYAGIAIEIMHNFTLVHDDIMDRAHLRRGNPTVHKKWNESTAILSGDAMMGIAYRIIVRHTPIEYLAEVMELFTAGFIEVCEGQAMDIQFSQDASVSLDDYMLMIEKKTARLPEIAAVIGARLGGASAEEALLIREFALKAGIAFQIQDDLLDLTADQAELGKTIGQDLVEGKKTFMILRMKEAVQTEADKDLMNRFFANRGVMIEEVDAMREAMQRCGVLDETREFIRRQFDASLSALEQVRCNDASDDLRSLVAMLLARKK